MADDPQFWHAAAAAELTLTSAGTSSRPQLSQNLSVASTGVAHCGHASGITSASEA
jgi:hypothetical protein